MVDERRRNFRNSRRTAAHRRTKELIRLDSLLITAQRQLVTQGALEPADGQATTAPDLLKALRVIKTHCEMLLSNAAGTLTAEEIQGLTAITSFTDRMLRRIDDLLDRTKIELGRMEPDTPATKRGGLADDAMPLPRRRSRAQTG